MTKILIVDDIEENRYLLKNYLESDGYIVIEAKNGIEALEILRSNGVNLIISDILMPQMDGFSLCRAVKQDKDLKKIPFVFYTATYTDEQDEKLAISLGASQFILKPKEKDEFNSLIKEVLDKYDVGKLEVQQINDDSPVSYFKLYNEVLVKKLESKMIQLEKVNKILQDEIEARKKAEEKAIKNSTYLDNIINVMPNPFVIIDDKFHIIKVNAKFCALYGKEEELLNSNFFEIRDSFFASTNLKMLFEEMLGNKLEIDNYEVNYNDKNLFNSYYNIRAKAIFSERNNRFEIIIIMEDISEKKKLIIDKDHIHNQLVHSQRIESIGRFAGGIAHDFNNLLTVIINCSQNITETINQDDPVYEDAKNIFEAALKGAELTKKILTFSRKQELNPQIIDIHNSFNDFDKMLKRLIGENITIKYELDATERKVLIDPISFEQILINLFSNARDAMPNGGTIKVTTKNKEYLYNNDKNIVPGKYIKIEISDTGNGIDKEIISKIFDPYFSTKKAGQGTGLGLYLVFSIIEQANGYIYACSEPVKGTTFTILLPITYEEEKNYIKIDDKKNLTKLKNILIIEDDPFVSIAIEKMFSKLNIFTKKAKNSKEAIKLIEEENYLPDLVICDIILEDISGELLVKILMKKLPNLKVIYMSGYSSEEIINKKIHIDDSSFIQKPFTIRELQDKIYKLMLN